MTESARVAVGGGGGMTESARVAVGGVEVSVDHLIGGERVASAHTFECRSPLDWDRKLADVARGDGATAERAVGAAVDGFRDWRALPVGERAVALRRLADLIEARNDDIALVETLDIGFLHRSMRERLVARGRSTSGSTGTWPRPTPSPAGRRGAPPTRCSACRPDRRW